MKREATVTCQRCLAVTKGLYQASYYKRLEQIGFYRLCEVCIGKESPNKNNVHHPKHQKVIHGRKKTSRETPFINEYGYRFVRGEKDRIIAEHRFVMQLFLGRKLVKGEEVHHKNGQRADNRIDNLELWLRPHPPGQRIHDLAIEHLIMLHPKSYVDLLKKVQAARDKLARDRVQGC